MRWRYGLAVLVGVLAVGSAAYGAGNKLPVFTAAQVAQMLVADNPPVSITLHNKTDAGLTSGSTKILAATCRQTGPKFRCRTTFGDQYGANSNYAPGTANLTVRVRAFKPQPSVCVSFTLQVPAGCWATADGARDIHRDGLELFRTWRAGGVGLDQAGSSCVGYGSGFFICEDVPVNGDIPKPVKAAVVMSVSGPRVTQIR